MPSFSATPKPIPSINKHAAACSSQLGAVFDSSSEDDLNASRTDNCDSTLSTDSSISSVSLSDEEEDGRGSLLYSSDDTVRGRVPPNTPKNARTMPSESSTEQAWNVYGEAGDYTNEVIPSISGSISLTRQRRISRLSNELHTVLAPHTLGAHARRRSMPDGNSYHYVHNELDYHMHYHQDPHPHLNEQTQQQRVLEPKLQLPSPSPPPSPQHYKTTYPQHNLCPMEYDRVDRWRIFAGTFTPLPIRSPDCGTPIFTPPLIYTPPQTSNVGSPAPVSPVLLFQKLRALSNELNRGPHHTSNSARTNANNITSLRRTGGRGRGRSVRTGNGRNHATALGVNGAFEKRGKEIKREYGKLAGRSAHGIQISSRSPSPSPSISPPLFPSLFPAKSSTTLHGPRKQARSCGGGSGSTRSPCSPCARPSSSSRPYEDSNWVVVDGEMEMISGMTVGFHESSMSEVDCLWDAPKPKFLQKLFQ